MHQIPDDITLLREALVCAERVARDAFHQVTRDKYAAEAQVLRERIARLEAENPHKCVVLEFPNGKKS